MKIAAIVITHNEEFRLNEWIKFHKKYKSNIYKHIIVDNGSDYEYNKKIKEVFTESYIIRNENNLGSTGAYNTGIRIALSDPVVDAILLIGNDIEIEGEGIKQLYNFLYSDSEYMVAAPVLLKKDSYLVESYGIKINCRNLRFEHQYENVHINEIDTPWVYSDSIPGAINLSKRCFFESVGLLDESLFMYAEELDLGIRAKKLGKKIVVTKLATAWHQHINAGNCKSRPPLSGFLMGRNEILIAKKYYNINTIINTILFRFYNAHKALIGTVIKFKGWSEFKYWLFYLLGVWAGITNTLKIPYLKNYQKPVSDKNQ